MSERRVAITGLGPVTPIGIGVEPFWDGLRCISGPIFRFPLKNSGPLGQWTYGPGLSAWSTGNLPPAGWLLPGVTMNFQSWFRDPLGPCGTKANTSNAIQALFTL